MQICPECSSPLLGEAQPRCEQCGWELRILDGIPDFLVASDRREQSSRTYIDNYVALAVKNLKESNLDRRYIRNQALNMADCITYNLSGAHICELGVGQGYLMNILLDRGVNSVVAVDIAITYLKKLIGMKRVSPVLANAERLPYKDEFDAIFATDIMEHVLNVGSFLYCLNRALKQEGRAYIRVPYKECLIKYSLYKGCPYAFAHVRSFNKDILKIYMKDAGFKVLGFRNDGFSLGTPQEYIRKNYRLATIYNKFSSWLTPRLPDPTSVTRWRSPMARVLMIPSEIIVIGEKAKSLEN